MPQQTAADRALQKVLADINAKMTPEGAERPVVTLGSLHKQVQFVPCSSLSMGFALGTGGWFRGLLHELFGGEHAGKTSLSMMALRDLFEYHDGKKKVVFVDVEHRFNEAWAVRIGLNPDENLILVQPPNAEMATDALNELIHTNQVCAFVWDSIGAAAGAATHKTFEEQSTMYGGVAAIMTRNVQTIAPLCNLYGVTGFYTNQLRADMEGYHRPMTPGGHAVKHMMSARIYIRRGKEKYYRKTAEGPVQVGYPMIMKTVKNSFGPAPREQWADFYFDRNLEIEGIGFDRDKELQSLALLVGVISRTSDTSTWYTYGDPDNGGFKANGRENLFGRLREEGLMDTMIQQVQTSLASGAVDGETLQEERPEADGPEIDDPEV